MKRLEVTFTLDALDMIRRDFLPLIERIANDPHRQDYGLQSDLERVRNQMRTVELTIAQEDA